MKANELRIGNWILIPYQNAPIVVPAHETQVQGITIFGEILTDNTPILEGLKTHYNHIFGISLTEEWLLKFGFDNINSKEYGIKCGSCWMSLSNPKDMGEWQDCYCWVFDRFKFIELKYVHQLQNLYFAFTGEELTIKSTDK